MCRIHIYTNATLFSLLYIYIYSFVALQRLPSDINQRAADMWSYAILLWELATREVPFADLSPMEVGMKVSVLSKPVVCEAAWKRSIISSSRALISQFVFHVFQLKCCLFR